MHVTTCVTNIFKPKGYEMHTGTVCRYTCDVGLEEGRYLRNCLCAEVFSTVYYHNGAQ